MDAYRMTTIEPARGKAEAIRRVVIDGTDDTHAVIARYSDSWGRFYVWQLGAEVPSSGASEPHASWQGAFSVTIRKLCPA